MKVLFYYVLSAVLFWIIVFVFPLSQYRWYRRLKVGDWYRVKTSFPDESYVISWTQTYPKLDCETLIRVESNEKYEESV